MKRSSTYKPIFFLLLFLLLSRTNIAQTYSIFGQVLCLENSMPIIGATVILENTGRGTTTDILGYFNFKDLPQGNYKLIISNLGFEKIVTEISHNVPPQNKFYLKPTSVHIKEVIISPNKSTENRGSISNLDRLFRPVNSSQDLLQLVPGLIIAQHAGGGKAEQIFLRGFDIDHGTDFNISVDGLPVNMVSHAHGQGYADFHFVIPETVDHLNVYKGPYTTRFGDFATSGTGEFFTKRSIERNEVKAELGMFDTYRVLGMFKLPDEKHLLSKENEDAYIASEYVFSNSYFNNKQKLSRFNLFGKYSGTINKNNYFVFSTSTFYADWNASGQVPQRAIEAGIIDRYGSIDPTEGGQTQRTNVNAIFTSTINNNAVLKNQFYYVNYYFNLYSNFTFFLNDPVRGDQINQTDRRHIFGYSGTYLKDFLFLKKTLHVAAGIGTRNDLINIALKNSEKRTILDTIVSGKVNQQNTNSFLDLTIDINKHFSINAGARIDYFHFNFSDDKADSLSGVKSIIRASPKLNFYYLVQENLHLFLKSGIGFHSNDARAVVINHVENSLPKAYGAEIGSEFKIGHRILVNTALWGLYLESELVYVGDAGTVETNNPTSRIGTDFSLRYQITDNFFADLDFNYNYGRLVGIEKGKNFIPLAPQITSMGGLTYKQDKGLNVSGRYRFIDSRPANETNSVTAKGSFIIDAVFAYKLSNLEFGFSIENLLNTVWNQAQFDTESRLFNEAAPVSELHYTPGTPFFMKGNVSLRF